jgi:hypothetical protein
MHIDLIQSLRCVAAHEDTWLVAAIEKMSGRHVVEGVLGCPVCRAEYPILDAIAYLGVDRHRAPHLLAPHEIAEEEVVRAAALLGLEEPSRTVVLAGHWADHAPQLISLTRAHVLALNPHVALPPDESISVAFAREVFPLLPGSVHAIALDADSEAAFGSRAAAHALRPGGRLVLPAHLPAPDEIEVLARDDRALVGERAEVSRPVRLERGGRGDA